jgi:N-acetylglutamate synthase-like GNAT family acetyltransferase
MDLKAIPAGSTEPMDLDQGTSSAPRAGEAVEQGAGDERYNLQFSPESPVKEVNSQDLGSVIDGFRASVGKYYKDKDGKQVSAPPLPLPQKAEGSVSNRSSRTIEGPTPYPLTQKDRLQLPHAPSEFEAVGWNNRGIRSRRLAQAAKVPLTQEHTQLSRYDLGNGETAAIMNLHHRNDDIGQFTTIETLATHPGTQGVGTTMVEHAVNVSEAAGQQGNIVHVNAVSEESESFFRSQGFTGGAKFLKLDPSKEKDLWTKKDGKWALKKNEGKKYGTLVPRSNAAASSSSSAPSKRPNETTPEPQPKDSRSKRQRP